jgi:DNA mismatch repair protein MutH
LDWKTRFTKWPLPYDYRSAESLEAHALALVNKTLRPFVPAPTFINPADRGRFGLLLEEYYFFKAPDGSPRPDFPEAAVELKSSPLRWLKSKVLVPKERLVLGLINYDKVELEAWETSSFLGKNAKLLLVLYLFERGRSALDHEIKLVGLWAFPDEDLQIIRKDWEFIVDKIRRDAADELSEGDTLYLGACTKAATSSSRRTVRSGRLVKPRAFALKQGYMRYILQKHFLKMDIGTEPFLKKTQQKKQAAGFEDMVHNRFRRFIGNTAAEIATKLELKASNAKNFHAAVTKKVLGISPDRAIEEFEKAEIIHRTIRLKNSGLPKEDVSFKAFKPLDLVKEKWEESEFRTTLTRRFFFVVYKADEKGIFRLFKTVFWSMPAQDRELEARAVWEEAIRRLKKPEKNQMPGKPFSRVSHVRPHGKNKNDTVPTPGGWRITKQCFWLNSQYVRDQLGLG